MHTAVNVDESTIVVVENVLYTIVVEVGGSTAKQMSISAMV